MYGLFIVYYGLHPLYLQIAARKVVLQFCAVTEAYHRNLWHPCANTYPTLWHSSNTIELHFGGSDFKSHLFQLLKQYLNTHLQFCMCYIFSRTVWPFAPCHAPTDVWHNGTKLSVNLSLCLSPFHCEGLPDKYIHSKGLWIMFWNFCSIIMV